MSGVLKKIGKRKLVFAAMLVLGALCICARLYVVGVLLPAGALVNEAALRRISRQRELFIAGSRVRNVDYLLIGDMCRATDIVPAGKTYVQLAAPGRSLAASYEILRHTHSILKEDGGCVVLTPAGGKSGYSVYDVPFFHTVTVSRLGLSTLRKMQRLPALFAPWRTARFLLGVAGRGWRESECPKREITDFCAERSIVLKYMCK